MNFPQRTCTVNFRLDIYSQPRPGLTPQAFQTLYNHHLDTRKPGRTYLMFVEQH